MPREKGWRFARAARVVREGADDGAPARGILKISRVKSRSFPSNPLFVMRSARQIRAAFIALFCAAGGFAFADDAVPLPADTFLAPPKAADVTAFANDIKLPPDFKGVAVTVDKEKVMEFLASGEVEPAGRDRAKWRTLADLTLPGAIANNPILLAVQKESAQMPNGKVFFNSFIHTGGVVATGAGGIYFWQLWNDRVLELDDDAGRSCLLVLGPGAQPLANFLHPYDDPGKAKKPAKKPYGKLPVPAENDIVAVCNRPDGGLTEGRRNYLAPDRVKSYLRACTNMASGTPWLARFDERLNPFLLGANAPIIARDPGRNLFRAMEGDGNDDVVTDGVMLTRDNRFIFWREGSEGIFYLMDEQRRTCCVQTNNRGDDPRWSFAVYIQASVAGSRRVGVLTIQELCNGEEWRAYQPPPLDRQKAVRSAWEALARTAADKDPSAWRVSRVATTRAGTDAGWKWYYTVWFENQKEPDEAVPVPVSMDGIAGGIYSPEDSTKKVQAARQQYIHDNPGVFNTNDDVFGDVMK